LLVYFLSTKAKPFGSDYRTVCRSSYLKPYSTATCNVTVMHDESVVGLVEAGALKKMNIHQ